MTLAPNLGHLVQEMLTRSAMLDEAIDDLKGRTHEWAANEHAYRKARAIAYLGTEGTVGQREAMTAKATAKLRHDAHLAEGLRVAALEAVRSRRAQLSAVQSIANAVKAEAQLAGYSEP